VAIRALAVKRGRIQRLEIEELEVGRLHVRELVERWEGGLIGPEQAKLAVRYAKGKEEQGHVPFGNRKTIPSCGAVDGPPHRALSAVIGRLWR
jgi:hypothetical protein